MVASIHQAAAANTVRGGFLTQQRAAILLCLVAGVQMMRQMIGLTALTDADPATLIGLLASLLQQLMTGRLGATTTKRR